ncbi:hypothetical protein KOI35_32545 [Actinoplanes bogorensis]|uniref:Secreted protein n=1 Tax=Paractinoplanes bogorensis TaxID=1610840 RepID=A0ABS5YXS8_9ACTN|nr:DUF6493 family protein [Actinoplanes bogorensis]MBU2668252.1 hypothetical protein [Actinoplanes bogorensis]
MSRILAAVDSGASAVTVLLESATEEERLAFGREIEARLKAMKPEDWWRPKTDPSSALALAALGSMPSAARAAALLSRRDLREKWGRMPLPLALRVVRARSVPWLGDLAGRLATRLRPDEAWQGGWSFVAALLTESGATVSPTEGVVVGWLVDLQQQNRRPFADRLRESPYLDTLLPAVFEIDGIGAHLATTMWDQVAGQWTETPAFPAAVAQLVAEGRLERKTILDATIDRLVRGDRPAWLRPFALLHDELAPTVDEMAAHTLDYAQLLPDAPSAIAGIAQRSLREVDAAGRLELDTLLTASRPTLVRKEKTLVKAQLSWLDRVARRDPSREVLETVAAAFDHPVLEIQERALTLIAKRGAGSDLSWLTDTAANLGGDLPGRARQLAGSSGSSSLSTPAPGPLPASPLPSPPLAALSAPPPVAALPAAIGSASELAEEVVALLHQETSLRWERVLAGVVSLRSTGDLSPVRHVVDRYTDSFADQRWRPRLHALGSALRTILGDPVPGEQGNSPWQRLVDTVRARLRGDDTTHRPPLGSPETLLTLRVVELSTLSRTVPVTTLMATPTHVNGNLDAAVLADRLRQAEAEGWQPWPLDLEQALLRLPRGTSPAVAEGLSSPAGRRFAEWLTRGGLPDPVSSRFKQLAGQSRAYYSGGPPAVARVVVNVAPATPGLLSVEDDLVTRRNRVSVTSYGEPVAIYPDVLAATLPHHREVIAAWALPELAALADQDERGHGTLLPTLAENEGPFGPAMSLALAYVSAARHEPDRVTAVDAFLTLAARPASAAATSASLTPAVRPATVTATHDSLATSAPTPVEQSTTEAAGTSLTALATTAQPSASDAPASHESRESFGASIGRDLGELGAAGMVKLNRVALSLGDAHRAGASAAVWDVLSTALPSLLPTAPRGLPDLLELACLVAAATGTRGELPGLAEVAERKGNSRLLKEARRLRTVLAG